MATTKGEPIYNSQLPPSPVLRQNYVVLPLYFPTGHLRRRCLLCIASLISLAIAVYVFWPSDPDLKVERLRLNHLQIHTRPHVTIDISLNLTVKIRNTDLYSLDYSFLDVTIGYRGKKLGYVTSDNGHVMARGSSYVDAKLELSGIEVFSDVIYLLEDLAKGSIPFDTTTEVKGRLGMFLVKFPLKVSYF